MDFLIKGLPENENHEKKTSKKAHDGNDEIESFMKAMGMQPLQLPDISSLNFGDPNDIANLMTNLLGILDPSSQNNNQNTSSCSNCSGTKASANQAQNIEFKNGEPSEFFDTPLASITILESDNIKNDFFTVFGISGDDNISLDTLKGLPFHGDFTEDDFFTLFDHYGVLGYSEKYLLCTTVPSISDDLGIFFAIVNTPTGFEVVVPSYGNTYFKSNDTVSLYNCNEHSEMYENGTFRFTNISKIRLALDWMLYTEQDHRFSPTDFGIIKPILSGAEITERDGSTYVYIGHIISNNSDESEQFKKDIGCENTKVFDFYIRLENKECQPSVLAKALKNVDFNNCSLFKNAILMNRGSALYINADLGVIPKYLYKIIMNTIDDNDYMY